MDNRTNASVVLVDDEELAITSLRALIELEGDLNVKSFTDPLQAAALVKAEPVDIIVSDYLMPGMNGIQLLAHAKQ